MTIGIEAWSQDGFQLKEDTQYAGATKQIEPTLKEAIMGKL